MNLQAELDVVQQQIYDEKQKLGQKDMDRIAELEKQEADLLERLMNEQVESNHESRIQESASVIAHELDNLEISGLKMRQMCVSEDDYQMLRIRFQQMMEDRDDAWSRKVKGFEERELQRERQLENMQVRYNDLERENSRLSAFANEQETRADDAESKRDASVRENEELRAENEQLKGWNTDLRNQASLGVSGAIRIVDEAEIARRKAEEEERAERIKAARTVYDLKGDVEINPKNYTAKRVIDGEEITFNWTQRNNYIVLDDPQQVLSFRSQHEANSAIPNLPLVEISTPSVEIVTPIQFRESADDLEEPAAGTNDGAGTNAEPVGLGHDPQVLAAKVATLESTVDALTADVEALKRRMAA